MKKHTWRTVLVYAVLVVSLIYIYPTVGWMTLDPEERARRMEAWADQDDQWALDKPNFWRDTKRAVQRWAEFDEQQVINLGLDLQGGIRMVIGLNMDEVDPEYKAERLEAGWTEQEIKEELQLTALRTIERRVNEFGSREPLIQTYGENQIQVQLPGETDIERARDLIMKQAHLEFHIEAGPQETDQVFSDIENAFPREFFAYLLRENQGVYFVKTQGFEQVREVIAKAREREGLIPEDKIIRFSKKPKPWETEQRYRLHLLNANAEMTGEHLAAAYARVDDQSMTGGWMINFEMDAQGAVDFGEVTQENIGQNLAIVVDDVVEGSPTIRSRISSRGQISGRFTREEAIDLAIALSSGSMPVPIEEDLSAIVGATLGEDSIRKGVTSALVGLAIVVLFMIFYYRLSGLVATLALVYNSILIVGALAYLDATLTLPGIAGLILTIGMAVDANVLIFERIREEIRNGRSIAASVENGFTRAQVTILDANITTLIAAAVLIQFGTGPIQGFAVTLSIGVLASVFSALVVSRAAFDFLANVGVLGKLSMTSVIKPDTHIPFLNQRMKALLISVLLIGVGAAAFGYRTTTDYGMFGVDFTTGTNMVISLDTDSPVDVEEVRAQLTSAGYREPIVQWYEPTEASPNRFLVRISDLEAQPQAEGTAETGGDATVSGQVQEALVTLIPGAETAAAVQLEQVETVGPAVGRQLKYDALKAIAFALIFIVAYLAFRFEWRFAAGAVAALVHDVAVTLALFALFGRQISLPVVAAILTIIGYSLNDTIVVYDRIREDLRLYRGRGMSYPDLMDLSINQTLSRTLLTSLTTLFVVVVLFLFGGEVINDFAFALIVGVVVGTYSSIYIASPVVYYLQKLQGKTQVGGQEEQGPGTRRRKQGKKKKVDEESEAPA